METAFFIDGKPHGKGRPRFTRSGHCYTDKATKDYEDKIKLAYKLSGGRMLSGNISADFVIGVKSKQSDIGRFIAKKPDIDNVIKSVLDALNGIAYDDDRQIVHISAKRIVDNTNSDFLMVRLLEVK